MAKVTAPMLSFGGSGQIGKAIVYSKWKGRPYARQLVTPANPKTVEQSKTRNVFTVSSAIWRGAPTLFQAPWKAAATGQVKTDRNIFMGRYITLNRGLADLLLMEFSPGAKGGLAPDAIAVAAVAGGLDVTLTMPAAPIGWTLVAGVAAAIRDGDPATTTLLTVTAVEDLAAPYVVSLTGLTSAQLYVVGGWTRWTKPDGSTAYGPSLTSSGTPT